MPFVTIRIVKQVIEHDPDRIKAKVQTAVTNEIAQAAGIPKENVWVTFEEVDETDWFAGGERVKELRAGS